MAQKYASGLGKTRLPPIRRKFHSANNCEVKELGFDPSASPFSLPRLPRIGNQQIPASKRTCPDKLERRGNRTSLSFTTDKKVPCLLTTAPELDKPFERSAKKQWRISIEEKLMGPAAHGVDGVYPKEIVKEGSLESNENRRSFLRRDHIFRRRLRPSKAYQQQDSHMSHRELLAFDQNMEHLLTFTERDKVLELRDFNGKKMNSNKTGNYDIMSCVSMFEVEKGVDNNTSEESENCASMKKGGFEDSELSSRREETKNRVRGRFYEALDLHFYHYYRNAHPQRRMAICEEIERGIVVDSITLSWYRENLRLQDVLNTWVL